MLSGVSDGGSTVARPAIWPLVLAATVAAAIVIMGSLALADTVEGGWRSATRGTARLALILLLIAYAASSLNLLVGGRLTLELMRRRRPIGLSFAAVMAIHVFCILALAAVARDGHVLHVVDTGGVAYAFIAVLALTSNDYSMRLLGPWWKRLHTVAIHVVLIKFASLVYQKAASGSLISLILLVMIGCSVVLRIAAAFVSTSRTVTSAEAR